MPELKYDGLLEIATGNGRNSKSWKNKKMEWSAFVERVSRTTRTHETVAEYAAAIKSRQDELKDVGGFVGGIVSGGKRGKNNILCRQLVTLDIDHAGPGVWDEFTMVSNGAALVYSTHKHTPAAPRLRLIVPLDREVGPDEYEAIARRIAGDIGIEIFDITTFQPSRLMFWPSTSKDGVYEFQYQDGPFWEADKILSTYHDWRDSTEWPISIRHNKVIDRNIKKQGDPLEKQGVVGAFCRTYSIADAIDTFLSDVYSPCDVEDRYTYREGSTSGGLVVYEEKYTFSHHGTDPTSMKLCNAFDLVRIHKFGIRDEDAREGTPGNKLPSYVAMVEYATKDKAVRRQLGTERLAEASADFADVDDGDTVLGKWGVSAGGEISGMGGAAQGAATSEDDASEDDMLGISGGCAGGGGIAGNMGTEPEYPDDVAPDLGPVNPDWITDLDVDKKGNYFSTLDNVVIILENDPVFRGKLAFNTFDQREAVRGKLAFRNSGNTSAYLTDRDLAGIKHYIERTYSITVGLKVEDALKIVMEKNQFHPIKQFLEKQRWDGRARVDTLLVDYLGVTDSPYSRAIIRKALCAAVARIYTPGCKFDYALTLIGKQGIKKSTLIDKLGGKWFSDSFTTMQGKEAYEQLQGAWLIEIAELAGMKKADIETVKHFITKRKDRYRVSYGRRVEDFPRQCVFFPTTNDRTPLKDNTGGRRFWPAVCDAAKACRDASKDLTRYEVGQIWAEVVVRWKAGELLYLSPELEAVAYELQADHTEGDERAGLVRIYLDTLLPDGWDGMTTYERRGWLAATDKEITEAGAGKHERTKVCALEIYAELFGGRLENVSKHSTREIREVLDSIPGWQAHKTKVRFTDFGVQKGYYRVPKIELL